MPVTVLLKALGNDTEFILNYFYEIEHVVKEDDQFMMMVGEALLGEKAPLDIEDPKTKEVIVKKGRKINKLSLRRMTEAGVKFVPIEEEALIGKILSRDVKDPQTGEVVRRCNEEITAQDVEEIKKRDIKELYFIHLDEDKSNASIRETLLVDKLESKEDAIIEIYRRLRPSNPPRRRRPRRSSIASFLTQIPTTCPTWAGRR